MKPIHTQNQPQFTRVQLDWLSGIFYENLSDDVTPEQLYRSQGQRQVINKIRSLVELSEKKGVI